MNSVFGIKSVTMNNSNRVIVCCLEGCGGEIAEVSGQFVFDCV